MYIYIYIQRNICAFKEIMCVSFNVYMYYIYICRYIYIYISFCLYISYYTYMYIYIQTVNNLMNHKASGENVDLEGLGSATPRRQLQHKRNKQ